MGYEVDFFTVGDDKPGDAICMRYGNLHGAREEQRVVVIDGGTIESGEAIIERILNYYKTKWIDAVFLTHPHQDHMMGLFEIFKRFHVKSFYTHIPLNHSKMIKRFLDNDKKPARKARQYLKNDLKELERIIQLAKDSNAVIIEPFSDDYKQYSEDKYIILGPSRTYYADCIAASMENRTSTLDKAQSQPTSQCVPQQSSLPELVRHLSGTNPPAISPAYAALGLSDLSNSLGTPSPNEPALSLSKGIFTGMPARDSLIKALANPDNPYLNTESSYGLRPPEPTPALQHDTPSNISISHSSPTNAEDQDPINNSSTIILFKIGGNHLLFTGDAGIPALNRALDRANQIGIQLFRPQLFKIPHHGSRRNLNPRILNKLFGKPTKSSGRKEIISSNYFAIACTAKDNKEYPNSWIKDNLKRRGYTVISTEENHWRISAIPKNN